jgi:hypothetical protein
MVVFEITRDEVGGGFWVDRDGSLNDHGAQGFDVSVSGAKIHFEDERDAVLLARQILYRMGEGEKPDRPV